MKKYYNGIQDFLIKRLNTKVVRLPKAMKMKPGCPGKPSPRRNRACNTIAPPKPKSMRISSKTGRLRD